MRKNNLPEKTTHQTKQTTRKSNLPEKQDDVERSRLLYILLLVIINSSYILASWVSAKMLLEDIAGDRVLQPAG